MQKMQQALVCSTCSKGALSNLVVGGAQMSLAPGRTCPLVLVGPVLQPELSGALGCLQRANQSSPKIRQDKQRPTHSGSLIGAPVPC